MGPITGKLSSFNPFHGKLAIREGSSFAKTGIIKPLHEKSGPDNFRSFIKKRQFERQQPRN